MPDENTSDGYHTFGELYEHRNTLYIALCRYARAYDIFNTDEGKGDVWRSKLHHDGSGYPSWFIMGIGRKPGKQITYHLPLYLWEETNFAITLDRAPEWDNHTPADVIIRLRRL